MTGSMVCCKVCLDQFDCTVSWSLLNRVQAKVRQIVCYAHKLNLLLSQAVSSTYKGLHFLVNGSGFAFFSISSKKTFFGYDKGFPKSGERHIALKGPTKFWRTQTSRLEFMLMAQFHYLHALLQNSAYAPDYDVHCQNISEHFQLPKTYDTIP